MMNGAASQLLGIGSNDPLQKQVTDEADEQRKKRLQLAQVRQAVGPASMLLSLGAV